MSRTTIEWVRSFWLNDESLGTKAARAGVVTIGGRVVIKALQFVRTLVLARLLFPHDFGLFALASIAMGLADLVFQPGFNTTLIHEKDDIRPYLSSVWTANIIRNSILGSLLALSAPIIAGFFNEPLLVSIIPVLALTMVLVGFENPGIIYFQRDLQYKRKFLLDTMLVLGEIIVVVIAGFIFHNVWALVIGSVGNRVIAVALSFALHPFRPRFAFDWRRLRKLMGFGKWIWATGILMYIIGKIDVVAIGKLLDTESLGYYQAAVSLAMLPTIEIARSLLSVVYPYYSRVRDDRAQLGRAFMTATTLMFSASLPILFGLLAVAPETVRLLYGEKWLPVAPILAITIFYGLGRSIEFYLVPLALSLGRPYVQTIGTVIQGVLLAALVPVFIASFGILGAAWAIVLSAWASVAVMFVLCSLAVRELPRWLWRALLAPTTASLLMYTIVASLKPFWGEYWGVMLAGSIFVGIVSYVVILLCIDKLFGGTVRTALAWVKGKL